MISCDCAYPKPPPIEKQTRYPLLVLAVFAEVAMMNTSDSTPIALEFLTRT